MWLKVCFDFCSRHLAAKSHSCAKGKGSLRSYVIGALNFRGYAYALNTIIYSSRFQSLELLVKDRLSECLFFLLLPKRPTRWRLSAYKGHNLFKFNCKFVSFFSFFQISVEYHQPWTLFECNIWEIIMEVMYLI